MTQTILLMLIHARRIQVVKHSIKTSLRFVFFASPAPLPHWQVSGRRWPCPACPRTGRHPRTERARREEEGEDLANSSLQTRAGVS